MKPHPLQQFATPRQILATLLVCVFALAGTVLIEWLWSPQTIRIEITEPVGKTIVTHLVVDGRPESRTDVVPVTYQFHAHELRYAVIGLEPDAPARITLTIRDRSGTGGQRSSEGITGAYTSGWWGSTSSISAMTPVHVESMRRAVRAERANRIELDMTPDNDPETAIERPNYR